MALSFRILSPTWACLVCLLVTPGAASASEQADPLTLGVFPYFDPATLASLHLPLKTHLSSTSGQRMTLVSAPDFRTFKQRSHEGRYDVLVTAPHLGRIAQLHGDYEWLAFTSNYSHAVFVALAASGITQVEDLRGKTLALPPKGAIIHHLALAHLEMHGLLPGNDVMIETLSSHNNAMLAAIRGDVDAAAFGRPTWLRYAAPDRERLQLIDQSEQIPGFAVLVHPRIDAAVRKSIGKGLFAFPDTDAGQAYFDATGLDGIRPANDTDMELLDRYIERMAAALNPQR